MRAGARLTTIKVSGKLKNKTDDIHLKSGLNLLGHFKLEDCIRNNESTFQSRNRITKQKALIFKI